ncbi:MAG: segregation/condensation protein A [Candidatus Uhrbacteria bacterium]
MPHAVKLEQFEGPLDLLLRLIEQEELDITAIALAEVCEEYLAHLKQVEHRLPEEVADFLVIAAKLIYLKSLELVPAIEGEEHEDVTGLADQLRIYRAFVEASQELAERYQADACSFAFQGARTLPGREKRPFTPPPRLTVAILQQTYAHLIREIEPIVRIPRAVIGRVISIDDRIAEIRRLILDQPHASFEEVLRGKNGRDECIVSFLAILELMKQEEIRVKQDSQFAPIRIDRPRTSASSTNRPLTILHT